MVKQEGVQIERIPDDLGRHCSCASARRLVREIVYFCACISRGTKRGSMKTKQSLDPLIELTVQRPFDGGTIA